MPGTALRLTTAAVESVVLGLGVMMRSSTASSPWNRCLRLTIKREKSRVPNSPLTMGATNSCHRRSAVERKLSRSRPVCLLSDSYTAPRKRFHSQASSSAARSGV